MFVCLPAPPARGSILRHLNESLALLNRELCDHGDGPKGVAVEAETTAECLAQYCSVLEPPVRRLLAAPDTLHDFQALGIGEHAARALDVAGGSPMYPSSALQQSYSSSSVITPFGNISMSEVPAGKGP